MKSKIDWLQRQLRANKQRAFVSQDRLMTQRRPLPEALHAGSVECSYRMSVVSVAVLSGLENTRIFAF